MKNISNPASFHFTSYLNKNHPPKKKTILSQNTKKFQETPRAAIKQTKKPKKDNYPLYNPISNKILMQTLTPETQLLFPKVITI